MIYEIGSYVVTPLSLLLLISGIVAITISLYLLQYRRNPGVFHLSLLLFFTFIWTFSYSCEIAAITTSLKLIWTKLSYFGIIYTPVTFLMFSLSFSSRDNLLNKSVKIALGLLPLLFIALVFTNDLHHLHWESISVNGRLNTISYTYGVSSWVMFIFTYSLLLVGIVNIIQLLLRFPEHFHSQLPVLILACFLPVAGNVLYLLNVSPVSGFDWTPLAFLASGLLFTYINLKYGIFNLIPFARNTLIDIMHDGVVVIDRHGKIADVNPEFVKVSGADASKIMGKKLSEAFPKLKNLIEQINGNEGIEQLEVSTELDNKKYSFDIRISALYDRRRIYSGKLIVLRDITERSKTEKETQVVNQRLMAEISEKEKLIVDLDAFAHTVAHDLKNMIGAIVTCTDMMEMEINSSNYQGMHEINDLVRQSANKTLHVTKELLTLASVRQQEVKLEQIDMSKTVKESMDRLKDMIKTHHAQIKMPLSWPTALGYAPWIEEVWVNYLSNAIKYGGSPPLLELGADQFPMQHRVRFWVKDNGKGLNKAEQKMLFQKFSRLDPTRAEGNGLGLSIVKRIIEKLNGKVGVLSNPTDGEGSLFYFILPTSHDHPISEKEKV